MVPGNIPAAVEFFEQNPPADGVGVFLQNLRGFGDRNFPGSASQF